MEKRLTGEPYGPGKFSNDVDAYFYSRSLNGGPDDEISIDGGVWWYGLYGGVWWYGLLHFTDEDRAVIAHLDDWRDSVGCIMFERASGFVEVGYYKNSEEMEAQWDYLVDEASDDELE